MPRVLLIPGLGADERIFSKIQWPSQWDIIYVQWLDPTGIKSLGAYAQLLIQTYQIVGNDLVVGVSMGGMLSYEIAQRISVQFIVISSTPNPIHIHPLLGKFKFLIPYLPAGLFRIYHPLIANFFDCQSQDSRNLLAKIIRQSNPHWIKKFLFLIAYWPGVIDCIPLLQIHASHDRIIKANGNWQNLPGGHFAVYDFGMELSAIIHKFWIQYSSANYHI